jgi:hypothetical protein
MQSRRKCFLRTDIAVVTKHRPVRGLCLQHRGGRPTRTVLAAKIAVCCPKAFCLRKVPASLVPDCCFPGQRPVLLCRHCTLPCSSRVLLPRNHPAQKSGEATAARPASPPCCRRQHPPATLQQPYAGPGQLRPHRLGPDAHLYLSNVALAQHEHAHPALPDAASNTLWQLIL